MSKCKYEYKPSAIEYIPSQIPLDCKEQPTENGEFCVFHDKSRYIEHEQEAAKRFEEKVRNSINRNEPLVCFGYYLPGINFVQLLEGKRFEQLVYFNKATFYEEANFSMTNFSGTVDFSGATFSDGADFSGATFSEAPMFSAAKFSEKASFYQTTFSKEADFSGSKFLGETYFLKNKFTGESSFKYALFEQPNKVTFDDSDLSKVSFADSDITRIRFGDGITWGGEKGYEIIEEAWLRKIAKDEMDPDAKEITVELVLSVYRNLRENYEFRLRYEEAGQFFIREMELKRMYKGSETDRKKPKENHRLIRQISFTGLYYHLSRYGESISRPTLIAVITVILSTLFWVTQGNPILEPHFDPTQATNSTYSTFVGFEKAGNTTQWLKSFERSLADFLPLLSLGGKTEVGIIDYIIKIFGGGLTFVLLAIALRRKFERKYTK